MSESEQQLQDLRLAVSGCLGAVRTMVSALRRCGDPTLRPHLRRVDDRLDETAHMLGLQQHRAELKQVK